MPTAAGFLYLAVVLDAWSRKVVGWSMANHLRAELVLDAMETAIGQRRPKDVIHHSCLVPESRDATLTREAEEALWQAVFMVQPGQRREFEPSSKRRKKRPAPWPSATA